MSKDKGYRLEYVGSVNEWVVGQSPSSVDDERRSEEEAEVRL